MNKKYFLTFGFTVIVLILFFVNTIRVHAAITGGDHRGFLTVTGYPNSRCNANLSENDSITEDPSFYVTDAYIGGSGGWDDRISYAGVINNNIVVPNPPQVWGWTSPCDPHAVASTSDTASAQYIDVSAGNSNPGDRDTIGFVLTAFQERDEVSGTNTFHGDIAYGYTVHSCSPGSIVSGNQCLPVTGSISVGLHTAGCTGSCAVDLGWNVPSGAGGHSLNDNSDIYINGALWGGVVGASGQVTTSPLPANTYNFCVRGIDGWGNQTADLDCHQVTINPTPVVPPSNPTPMAATLSVASTQINLDSAHKNASDIVANTNSINGGSFFIGSDGCRPVAGSNNFPPLTLTYTCPDLLGPNISSDLPINVSSSISGGPYHADLQVTATGQDSTVVSGSPQIIHITYTINSDVNSVTPIINLPTSPTPSGTMTLSAVPTSVNSGDSAMLFWTIPTGAAFSSNCALGRWNGSTFTSLQTIVFGQQGGVFFTGSLFIGTTYRLVCPYPFTTGYSYKEVTVAVINPNNNNNPPPPPSGTLSCSAPADAISPYQTRATLANGKAGYNYNWSGYSPCSITNRELNDGSGGSNHWIDLDCGSNEGTYTLGVSEAANPSNSAQCTFNACPAGGCSPPPPPPSSPLSVATDGRWACADNDGPADETCPSQAFYLAGSWASSLSGNAPLNGVDARYTFPGSWAFYANRLDIDCTSDGTTDAFINRVDNITSPDRNYTWASVPVIDACNYTTPGTYTMTATAHQNYYGGSCNNPSGGCTYGTPQTAQITVIQPVNFSFTQTTWTIPSGTPRYRADYDYDDNGVLDKLDQDLLASYPGNGIACPSGKTCDVNGSGTFNITDAIAYATYLRTLDIHQGDPNQNAIAYLSSTTGGTVAMTATGAPVSSTFTPTSVSIPANGNGASLFTVLGSSSVGTYNITVTGTASGNAHSNNLTLNVLQVAVPTAPTLLAANNSTCGQINLTWQDNSNNETGFYVYRFAAPNTANNYVDGNGNRYNLVATLGANMTSYISNSSTDNPSTGSSYSYMVRAFNVVGFSNPSNLTTSIQDNACVSPVNGVCAATHYNCFAGTDDPTRNVDGTSTWTWYCKGSGGGIDSPQCSQDKNKPIFIEN